MSQPYVDNPKREPYSALLVLVTASAFGPYILPGVRTEQIVVYLGIIVVFPMLLRARLAPSGLMAIGLLGAIALISFAASFSPPVVDIAAGGSLTRGFDTFALPIAALGIGLLIADCSASSRDRLIDLFAKVIVVALVANALFSFFQLIFPLDSAGRLFWPQSDNTVTGTVAARAAGQGRHGGVFNQPVEAGTAYSVAGNAAIWLWVSRSQRPLKFALVVAMLFLGSALVVSKVFFYVGLPSMLIHWYFLPRSQSQRERLKSRQTKLLFVLGIAGIVVGVGSVQTGDGWRGFDLFSSLLSRPFQGIGALSAGRFGTDNDVSKTVAVVMDGSPLFGFGLRGLNTPYDTWLLETLVLSGIVGTALAGLLIVVILAAQERRIARFERSARAGLMRSVFVVIVGASFGFPALTGNRVGVLLWLALALTTLAPRGSRQEAEPNPAVAPRHRSHGATSGQILVKRGAGRRGPRFSPAVEGVDVAFTDDRDSP